MSSVPGTWPSQAAFAAHLSQSMRPLTIQSYLGAVSFNQIQAGLPHPSTASSPRLQYILKGIQRTSPMQNISPSHRTCWIGTTIFRQNYSVSGIVKDLLSREFIFSTASNPASSHCSSTNHSFLLRGSNGCKMA